jgi:hypothetical protein
LRNIAPFGRQQAAPLLFFEGCPFDIRTHLQRDVEDQWVYAGDLVRVGGNYSIVSNVAISNGKVKEPKEVLKTLLPKREKNNRGKHR